MHQSAFAPSSLSKKSASRISRGVIGCVLSCVLYGVSVVHNRNRVQPMAQESCKRNDSAVWARAAGLVEEIGRPSFKTRSG